MPTTVCPEDFDDVPAYRREIQRLNDKIADMHDQHIEQIENLIVRCNEMAKWISCHPASNDDKTADAVDRTLGDTTWRNLPNRMT